jgi:membrane protease YdiL (CAAX protease family)
MLLKNQGGEIRLIWRLLLLVVPFLTVAYLLRYVPIQLQTEIFINQGLPRSTALTRARTLVLEDPVWASVVGIIQGLTWYPLLTLLIRKVEKRVVSADDFGLNPSRNSFFLVLLAIILALGLYFGYFGVGGFFSQTSFSWSPEKLSILAILLMSLDFITNGFGEETAFRAYFQSRLIQRHGIWIGIALASSSFVLLHLLIYQYSGPVLIASVLLAAIYGVLYVWIGSIYLIGTMHALFNLVPRLLDQWPPDSGLLIVNGLGLLIVILLYLRFYKRENPG